MTIESGAPAGRERLKLRAGTIAWFLAIVVLLLGLPVLLDIGWFAPVVLIVLALLLALPIFWLVRRIFTGQRRQSAAKVYAKTALGVAAVVTLIVATPLYVLAAIPAVRPMTLPQATLSNGEKTVVFQGMVHIGSEGFYKSVVYDLEKALTEDYVIFYEGVRGDPAGDQWFSDTLAGGGDLSTNYTQMGDICGLDFQLTYFSLLDADIAARPERHVNADVSTADMMREYERLSAADPDFAARIEADKAPAPADGDTVGGDLAEAFAFVQSATPGQQSLIGVACRGYMTWLLGQKSEPSDLDPIILDFRNRELAKKIEEGPDKIFITYGANHLPGLLETLRASDPNWEIGSIKWMRGIDTPEELDGEI
ncbi:hypothetical protein [Devosia sediminis]|uniref:TraB/GumN family protein n=1 Tax=Devosia sediminis TaxID=2798801 RepID=A0A934IVU7_9HYPH|nr:hypothetical protein [Devosia sediminis]MBJ3783733.1 hypothetical protein [Devosia sediminis]